MRTPPANPPFAGGALWSRPGRRGLLRSTVRAAWLRPVGVQRGIRVRGRLAGPPSWLVVVG
jgi:hypothetical protein